MIFTLVLASHFISKWFLWRRKWTIISNDSAFCYRALKLMPMLTKRKYIETTSLNELIKIQSNVSIWTLNVSWCFSVSQLSCQLFCRSPFKWSSMYWRLVTLKSLIHSFIRNTYKFEFATAYVQWHFDKNKMLLSSKNFLDNFQWINYL